MSIFKMNDHMKTAAKSYAEGHYAHLAQRSHITDENLNACGDGLFKFIMIELSNEEDCSDVNDAIRRMRLASGEIEIVKIALENRT